MKRKTEYKLYSHAEIREAEAKANRTFAKAKTDASVKKAIRMKNEARAMRQLSW